MFREHIEKPIDPIPQVYADNLKRIKSEPDYSLTCVGIALLKSRIDGYDGLDGVYYSNEKKANCVSDFAERVKNIDGRPLFCYYTYTTDDVKDGYIQGLLPEFKERNNIKAFIKDKAECDCLVLYHETMNAVGIFVNSRDFRLYHLLLSFMSLYYPSIFKDKPMVDDDYALAKSLSTDKDKDKFFVCIKNLVKPYVMEFRRNQLSILMKDIHARKIENAKVNVDNKRIELGQVEERYSRMVGELRQLVVVYEGLMATEQFDEPEQELVEFLSSHDDILDLRIENNHLKFSVITLLNNYSEQAWASFSERGGIYDGEYGSNLLETFRKRSNRKILLDDIFSDSPHLMVKMAGNYDLDLDRCRVETHRTYNYNSVDPRFKSCITNPHLKIFECLGGYKDRIMPALQNRNYIAAIEFCVASAGSVNLDETTQTFRPFLGWILSTKEKVLRRKSDRVDMTPEEALNWLVEQKKKEEKE